MRSLITKVALLATSFAVPAFAHADRFTFTTPSSSMYFDLPSNPTSLTSSGVNFYVDGITYYTSTGSAVAARIYFNTSGDFAYESADGSFPFGVNTGEGLMFSGGTSNPTFTMGTYDLNYSLNFGSDLLGTATLSITPSPTPEPSSLLLMGTGFLGACAAGRRRQKS